MAKQSGFKLNRRAMNELVTHVIDTQGVAMMQRVADACNAELGEPDGYMVSTMGDNPLDKRDYRATCITASAHAITHDRKHDTLLRNFGVAEG